MLPTALDIANFTTNVVLGDHNRLEQGGTEQNHVGAKIVRPPKSGKNGRDDIAMIKLKDSIKQTAYAHAVCYDEDPASALIWPTEYGVVTGWGSRKQVDVLTLSIFDVKRLSVPYYIVNFLNT